ncbi:MAG: DNA double-strand break repair nuclease NurA [Chloroflexi bacterium]|nr:DNA double-strand break repair nuclease NurA [Chloroflexota bacterium]
MLDSELLLNALNERSPELLAWMQRFRASAVAGADALAELAELDAETIRARLAAHARPGALPTPERLPGQPLARPFDAPWHNRPAALAWAQEMLAGRSVAAIDGSQIMPSRDIALPLGVVQAAAYINRHTADGSYETPRWLELLTPDDLGLDGNDPESASEALVNQARYELECRSACQVMQQLACTSRMALVLVDGSLTLSFAGMLHPTLRTCYVQAVQAMLACSKETRVPLVGFIDRSYARDLTRMLSLLDTSAGMIEVPDAALLDRVLEWGMRSDLWVVARDDRLSQNPPDGIDYYRELHFAYLKTSSDNPPARIELPAWVQTAGLADEVADVVRAECIVGSGYPYALSSAHSQAVLSQPDALRLWRLLDRLLHEQGFELQLAAKAAAKQRRQ